MADNNATLKLPDGKSLEFPVLSGTTGPDVVDIRTLYGKSGMFTYDPGYLSTASCSSSITYIDGDAGVLLYRGYPIEQLAQHCDFLEVCYLLQYGELPDRKQKEEFVDIVTHHTMVHEQLARLYQGFRRDAPAAPQRQWVARRLFGRAFGAAAAIDVHGDRARACRRAADRGRLIVCRAAVGGACDHEGRRGGRGSDWTQRNRAGGTERGDGREYKPPHRCPCDIAPDHGPSPSEFYRRCQPFSGLRR